MNTKHDDHGMQEPRVSAAEIRKMLETELSLPARVGYTLLLLLDLAVGGAIASLLATEPDLPARTQIAFAVMIVIAAAWAVFFVWTLTRRKVLLARHRVISARLAVTFSAVYTAGALLAAALGEDIRTTGLFAAAFGAIMLLVAGILLARATKKLADLVKRKRALEQAIVAERSTSRA